MKYKEKRKKRVRMIISIAIVFVIFMGIILQSVGGNTNDNNTNLLENKNESESDDWVTALASDERQLIYLGTPSCSWCNKIRPELDSLKDKYNVDFVYVNIEKTSQTELNTIFEQLEIDANKFGTPYLVIVEEGRNVAEQVGYAPEKQLFDFYQKNGLIEKNVEYQ